MWLITNFGFFSVVKKSEDLKSDSLTIRSRAKGDLETLSQRYLPQMGPIVANAGTDYKYRAKVSQSEFAEAMKQIALDIDYSNFKSSVAKIQGSGRSNLYHQVWDVLCQLQDSEPKPERKSKPTSSRMSYGGVLFDNQGRILLRKPNNEFDGYVWTFPKGRTEKGSNAEETALREVLEETGYHAEIIGKVPGAFAGGTGDNEYFLMRPVGGPGPFDSRETEAIEWVQPGDAPRYIEMTRNTTGRKRDLAILQAAVAEYQKRFGDIP